MANLSRDYEDDRGQLILVTAFMLAVTFVALALVVNSAIFTENMATRDDVAGSHEALDFRSEVEANVGTLLTGVNHDESQGEDHLLDSIENVSQEGGLHQASHGRLVNLTWDKSDSEDGTLIAQHNASRNFTSANAKTDWNLTQDDTFDVRNFRINVTDPSELASGSSAFRVIANDTDSDSEWSLKIARYNSGNGVEIEVNHDDHSSETCKRDDVGAYAIIDVTSATVEGEPCLALGLLQDADGTQMWFGEGVDEYRIEFEDADNIQGTYSLIGNDSMQTSGGNVDSHPESPTAAIYSITVSYEFYTSEVGYETDIRVAPGEVSS